MKFYNTSPVVLIAQESTFSLETPKEKVSPQCVVDFFFFFVARQASTIDNTQITSYIFVTTETSELGNGTQTNKT